MQTKVKLETKPESPFVALGFFRKEARRQGWEEEEVRQFMNVALSADEQHLVKLIEEYTEQ